MPASLAAEPRTSSPLISASPGYVRLLHMLVLLYKRGKERIDYGRAFPTFLQLITLTGSIEMNYQSRLLDINLPLDVFRFH